MYCIFIEKIILQKESQPIYILAQTPYVVTEQGQRLQTSTLSSTDLNENHPSRTVLFPGHPVSNLISEGVCTTILCGLPNPTPCTSQMQPLWSPPPYSHGVDTSDFSHLLSTGPATLLLTLTCDSLTSWQPG